MEDIFLSPMEDIFRSPMEDIFLKVPPVSYMERVP